MSVINLTTSVTPRKVTVQGAGDFIATAGQRMVVETSPKGLDVTDETVPEGKVWRVHLDVTIVESDA